VEASKNAGKMQGDGVNNATYETKRLAVSERGVLFGGNANNGANAGFAYANSNNTPSNTNANIGSHLYLQNKERKNGTAALPLGKKHQKSERS